MGWARVTVEFKEQEQIGEFEIHRIEDIDAILPRIRDRIEEAIQRED